MRDITVKVCLGLVTEDLPDVAMEIDSGDVTMERALCVHNIHVSVMCDMYVTGDVSAGG
jgi:hypothetical protein